MKTLISALAIVLVLSLLVLPVAVMAASVAPEFWDDNFNEHDLDDIGFDGYQYFYLDPDDDGLSGTYISTDGLYTVQWSITGGEEPGEGLYLEFSNASPNIVAVVVKGGTNANIYRYGSGGVDSDSGLNAPINPNNGKPYGVSHVYFIFGTNPGTPVPELPAGLLFGLGLAGVGGIIFWRRKSASVKIG